jgi:cytochrome c-type biogenesis protein CcmH
LTLLFILIAACLLLVAGLFILPPLWRTQTITAAAMDERNVTIAKQHLAELSEQLQTGTLSQAQYDEQRAELELALSDDLSIENPIAANTQGRWMSFVLMGLIPLLAVMLYAGLGNFNAINPAPEMLASKKDPQQDAIIQMVEGLAQKMQANPNNAEGWMMLGKSYKHLDQYDKAVNAYEHAYKLLGDKTDVMLEYAEALSFANDELVTGKSADLVFKVLAKEPNNPNALWLAGMAKAQAGEFMAAKKLWTQLADSLPKGSEALQETQDLLTKLDAKIAEATGQPVEAPPVTKPETAPSAAVGDIAVIAQVSLAPELLAKTSPTDTVFIYAQAATGSPMPLAIVKKQVSDLPLSVTLTDSLAMTPAMKLSNFPEVKLLARVSKSGNAMKQAGDLIGLIGNVSVTDKMPHTIIVNEIVK